MQGLDHFLDRLLTEVRDRIQFRARLAHEVADSLDASTLEAVVGADSEFKLLDQDLIEALWENSEIASSLCPRIQPSDGKRRSGLRA